MATGLFGIFAGLWMLSPVILIILYFDQKQKIKQYKTHIAYLQSQLDSINPDTSDLKPANTPPVPVASIPPAYNPSAVRAPNYCIFCGMNLTPIFTSPSATTHNFCPSCGAKISPASAPNLAHTKQPAYTPPQTYSPASNAIDVSSTTKQGISMAAMILILGVFFILIAGTIFATTTWNTLANPIRALIIFILPVFFIAVSFITDKFLKLSLTSKAFYYLGCFFIPVAFLAVSQFAILGEWFTLSGGGAYAILATCLTLFAIANAFGVLRYKSAAFVYLAGFSVTATVWSAARVLGEWQIALFAVSVLSFLCILLFRKNHTGKIYRHLQLYSYLSVVLSALLNISLSIFASFHYDFPSLIFHTVAVAAIFAAYTFCVFNTGKAQKVFLSCYSLAAGWFVWSIANLLFGDIGNFWSVLSQFIETNSWSYGALYVNFNYAVLVTVGFGLLFFIFRFAPKIFGVKIRNTLSDIIFIPVFICLILLWLYPGGHHSLPSMFVSVAQPGYSHYWLAGACISILTIIFTILGADKGKHYANVFAHLMPFALLSLCAPLYMILNVDSHPRVITSEIIPTSAFYTFIAVAVIGIALNFMRSGMLQKRFSDSFNIAIISWGILWFLGSLISNYSAESWYMLSLGIYSAAVFAAGVIKGKYQRIWIWLSGFMLALSSYMLAFYYVSTNRFILLNILALYAAVLMVVPIIGFIRRKPMLPELTNISAILLNVCAAFGAFAYVSSYSILGIVSVAAMALLSIFSLYLAKRNSLNFIGVLAFWAIALSASIKLSGLTFGSDKYYVPIVTVGVMFAVVLVLGRLLFGKNILRDTNRGKFVDYLSISGIITPFVFLASSELFGVFNDKVVHGGSLLSIVYVLSFLGRNISNEYKSFNKPILSIAAIIGAIALWTQPYFTLSSYIRTEYALCVLLATMAILCLFWRGSNLSKHGMFIASVIAVVVQFGDILTGDNMVFDATLLGIIMAVMLFVSFFLKKRRWFLLSGATLVVFAMYLSRNFWMSIRWWVYLLVCGTIMIIAAAVYEYRRRSSKTQKNSHEES